MSSIQRGCLLDREVESGQAAFHGQAEMINHDRDHWGMSTFVAYCFEVRPEVIDV